MNDNKIDNLIDEKIDKKVDEVRAEIKKLVESLKNEDETNKIKNIDLIFTYIKDMNACITFFLMAFLSIAFVILLIPNSVATVLLISIIVGLIPIFFFITKTMYLIRYKALGKGRWVVLSLYLVLVVTIPISIFNATTQLTGLFDKINFLTQHTQPKDVSDGANDQKSSLPNSSEPT